MSELKKSKDSRGRASEVRDRERSRPRTRPLGGPWAAIPRRIGALVTGSGGTSPLLGAAGREFQC